MALDRGALALGPRLARRLGRLEVLGDLRLGVDHPRLHGVGQILLHLGVAQRLGKGSRRLLRLDLAGRGPSAGPVEALSMRSIGFFSVPTTSRTAAAAGAFETSGATLGPAPLAFGVSGA